MKKMRENIITKIKSKSRGRISDPTAIKRIMKEYYDFFSSKIDSLDEMDKRHKISCHA